MRFRLMAAMLAAILGAAALTSCALPGSSADDSLGRFAVAPGKYTLYNCNELAAATVTVTARERELLGLMQKAGNDADGQFVSAIAYQPDYVEVRGQLGELHNAALAKHCENVAPAVPPATASSRAIR